MATRARQSIAAPTQRRFANELPPYEKPDFPLNPAAQRALAQLPQNHSLKKLDEALLEAQSALSNAAADINDRLTSKTKSVEKRRNEQSPNGAEWEDGPEIEQKLADLQNRVERMTQRVDESMRKMIDARHGVQSMKDSLAALSEDARANASTQASTPPIRSQRHSRPDPGENGDDSDDYQDFEPTNPSTNTINQGSTLLSFRSKLEDAKTRYQSHSLTARYADNNEYRDFRRVVHDAQYPDGDRQLAHHSEWFQEHEAPAPGMTTRARHAMEEDDDDEDIAVSRATISTKCPLTLQELKDPLTSRKCPHSFEADAILSMIEHSSHRENGRPNGERYVQCPVTGCDQTLTRANLYTDNLLIRQIKRIQRAKDLEEEDGEEGNQTVRDSAGHTPVFIGDGDDGADVDDIVDGRVIPQTRAKVEPKSSYRIAGSAYTPPRATAGAIELAASSDEDEVEENDAMETDEDEHDAYDDGST